MSHPFNNVIEVLEQLESDNSRLFKEKVLTDNKDDLLLQRFLTLAFDPWKNWGVAKYNRPNPLPGNANHEDVELDTFMNLLEALNNRVMTGNKAREAVETAMSQFDALGQKWCERLLWRNLRCGVSATTINKIWPASIVPFAVALAESLTTVGVNGDFKITDPVKYPVRVEAKLDGLRCIAVKRNGEVTLYTRSGTELTSPGIQPIIDAIKKLPTDNIVFDGELLDDDGSWNSTVSGVMKNNKK